MVGTASPTVKLAGLLTLPSGLITTIETAPGVVLTAGGTVTFSSVELAKLVASATLFHRTIAPGTKPVPVIFTGNSGSSALAWSGNTRLIDRFAVAARMVKVAA